jgi:hypothetical protein
LKRQIQDNIKLNFSDVNVLEVYWCEFATH